MQTTNFTGLSAEDKNLLDAAEGALPLAYNPYSKFYVACAALDQAGKIFTAANFACSSSTSNLCAERSVIAVANAQGSRSLIKMALIVSNENPDDDSVVYSPCGVCRQLLQELAIISGQNLDLIISSQDKSRITMTSIKELLPLAYERQ